MGVAHQLKTQFDLTPREETEKKTERLRKDRGRRIRHPTKLEQKCIYEPKMILYLFVVAKRHQNGTQRNHRPIFIFLTVTW